MLNLSDGFKNRFIKHYFIPINFVILPVCLILFFFLIKPNIFEFRERAKVSRIKSDMRSMAVALEAYFVDYGAYPVWSVGEDAYNFESTNSDVVYWIPTFRKAEFNKGITILATLTTPIPYMSRFSVDTFTNKKEIYRYYCDNNNWILFSMGPDLDYDINPWSDLNNQNVIIAKTWDPTNDTTSSGDIPIVNREL